MKKEVVFEQDVGVDTALEFARMSGDWNPLHTDPEHASRTSYLRPVLHGAYAAGLVSRVAGMHIPGRDCLLHALRLRFVSPIILPVKLRVHGKLSPGTADVGTVNVIVTDAVSGRCYVEASYDFGYHATVASVEVRHPVKSGQINPSATVLVTGASGGLGSAIVQRLGERAIPLSRTGLRGSVTASSIDALGETLGDTRLDAIVHCAWPRPDNMRLTRLSSPRESIDFHLASPLYDILGLARLLQSNGSPNATLLLVGSAFAAPGRHNYRMPLYTLAKGIIPHLTRILALELASSGHRCVSVVYDVLDTGMNQQMSETTRQANADRTLSGTLPSAAEAADQVAWVLENHGMLLSGSTVSLIGGAMP